MPTIISTTTYNTPAGGSLSPTYNVLNQISTWGSLSYVYDANGNLTSGDGIKTYKYDAETRLIEIDYVGTSNKSVFAYDGLGHRVSDAETVSGTTTTTYYLWCPNMGTLSGGGLVPDGLGQAVGGMLCQTRNSSQTAIRRDLPEGEYNVSSGQKLIYMPDQLGSVRDVLDGTSGTLVESHDFTPYGAVARSSGTTPTDYQYAGLFAHSASGLNLANYRALDGVTGKWINRDPIREGGGINLYAYVGARPMDRTDPLGLCDNCGQPTSVKILYGMTENMGSYSIFSYQLLNANGVSMGGPQYSVIEHVTPAPHFNTNDEPISMTGSIFADKVGYQAPQTQNVYDLNVQTFDVQCGGQLYHLTTELAHISSYTNGSYFNDVIYIHP
jgi:RHS repeat-associated protein